MFAFNLFLELFGNINSKIIRDIDRPNLSETELRGRIIGNLRFFRWLWLASLAASLRPAPLWIDKVRNDSGNLTDMHLLLISQQAFCYQDTSYIGVFDEIFIIKLFSLGYQGVENVLVSLFTNELFKETLKFIVVKSNLLGIFYYER